MPDDTATVPITGDGDADRLLAAEPLALVIGMLLNQQAPRERAFRGPLLLKERLDGWCQSPRSAADRPVRSGPTVQESRSRVGRLPRREAPTANDTSHLGGSLDPRVIASADPDELAGLFAQPPALHRAAAAMAARTQDLCRHVVEHHGGRVEQVWEEATTGDELFAAVNALPGFGDRMARIFVVLLAEHLGVEPPGWQEVAGPYLDRTWFSVSPAPKPWTPTGRCG